MTFPIKLNNAFDVYSCLATQKHIKNSIYNISVLWLDSSNRKSWE